MSTSERFTIIRASAGSGKTYRLMEILTAELAAGLEPSQIIATTFTRKAAGELSERIQQRLLDEAANATPADKARLQEKILALPSALIGTVNSITDHLLRRYAVDAGLSPELSILSEQTEKRAFATATSPVFAKYESKYSDLLARMEYDLLPDRTSFGNATCWSNEVKDLVTKARSENLDPSTFPELAERSKAALREVLGDTVDVDLPGTVHRALQDARTEANALFAAAAKPGRNLVKTRDVLESRLDAVKPDNPREPWRTWMAPLGAKVRIFGEDTPAAIGRLVQEQVGGLVAYENAAFRADADQLIDITFAAAAECMKVYAEYKVALSQIDFVDQERLALELISTNRRVQQEIREQFSILIVDEFQDTSPIQLAFFMELSKYVERVIWVGDPKQSIYGFRGADPQLMAAAVDALSREASDNPANILKHSWRTHEVPLELSNRLFAPIFPDDAAAVLEIPEAKREEHRGGSIQWWAPAEATGNGGKTFTNTDNIGALGFGLRTAIDSEGPLAHGRAVLTRTNKQAQDIIAGLKEFGIVCEGSDNPLAATREGTAVIAALCLLLDSSDTQALLELVSILADHPAHATWFEELTSAKDRPALLRAWRDHESLAPLLGLTALTGMGALQDVVRAVITALDLPRRVRGWSMPEQRLANLQSLVETAAEYAATVPGEAAAFSILEFIEYLTGTSTTEGPRARAAAHPDAVKVMTVWKAKGLEWDSVLIPRYGNPRPRTPAGMFVDPAAEFDVFDPLAGRTLYYWPQTLLSAGASAELAAADLQRTQARAHADEDQRVLYVALTRSRRETIIVSNKAVSSALAPIAEHRALKLERNDGLTATMIPQEDVHEPVDNAFLVHRDHSVVDGKTGKPKTCPGCAECLEARLPMTSIYWPISPSDYPGELGTARRSPLASVFADGSEQSHVAAEFAPARFIPSKVDYATAPPALLSALGPAATVGEPVRIGPPLITRGGMHWDAVGNAVHAYLGVDTSVCDAAARLALAESIVTRWRVAERLTPEQLVSMGAAYHSWLEGAFGPSPTLVTEVPFAFSAADGAHAQGWIDAILQVPDGTWYIIDHKTFPGEDPASRIREHYLGQMSTYRAAAEAAGHRVGGVFMHLPLRGEVYPLTW